MLCYDTVGGGQIILNVVYHVWLRRSLTELHLVCWYSRKVRLNKNITRMIIAIQAAAAEEVYSPELTLCADHSDEHEKLVGPVSFRSST